MPVGSVFLFTRIFWKHLAHLKYISFCPKMHFLKFILNFFRRLYICNQCVVMYNEIFSRLCLMINRELLKIFNISRIYVYACVKHLQFSYEVNSFLRTRFSNMLLKFNDQHCRKYYANKITFRALCNLFPGVRF